MSDITEDEKPFPFRKLPPEMRNKIYRLALITEDNWPHDGRTSSLKQPALTRVNKQIRAEALPIFYGENDFYFSIPHKKNRLTCNRTDKWDQFKTMVDRLSTVDHLKHVSRIFAIYSERTWQPCRYTLGFRMSAAGGRHTGRFLMFNVGGTLRHVNVGCRIGNDALNWNDCKAVHKAFGKAITNSVLVHEPKNRAKLRRRVPIKRVSEALSLLASVFTGANVQHVDICWDYSLS